MWKSQKQEDSELKESLKRVRKLKYRDNNYFNDKDFFLLTNNTGQFYSTRVEFNKDGNWYGGNYKMTSVLSINSKELLN